MGDKPVLFKLLSFWVAPDPSMILLVMTYIASGNSVHNENDLLTSGSTHLCFKQVLIQVIHFLFPFWLDTGMGRSHWNIAGKAAGVKVAHMAPPCWHHLSAPNTGVITAGIFTHVFIPLHQEWQIQKLSRTEVVNIRGVLAYGEMKNVCIPKSIQLQI